MNKVSIFDRLLLVLGTVVLGSLAFPNIATAQSQFPNAQIVTKSTQLSAETEDIPVPGSVITAATALTNFVDVLSSENAGNKVNQNTQSPTQIAQADIDIGGATRGGSSYIGIAGNIGLNGGQSSLGDGNFAVISKVGLSRTLSVRPAAIFGDNTSILIPVTYDFPIASSDDPFREPLPIAPYVGAGAAVTTGDNSKVGFLLSGGVDLPLTEKFTATAGVNVGFFDETDIGLLLGVGYNFR